MYQLLDYYMVKCLYTKQELKRSIRSEDQMEGGSQSDKETIIDDPKDMLRLSRINFLKTNVIRMIPKRLGCSRFLKQEEKLFVHGLKRYQKSIDLSKFISNINKIR